MRRCLILYGLTLGVTLVLALREALLLTQGNELVVPLALGAGLLFVAIGAGVSARWVDGRSLGTPAVVMGLVIGGLLAPLTLLYLRCLPLFISTPPLPLTHPYAVHALAPLAMLGLAPACMAAGLFAALAQGIQRRSGEHAARAIVFILLYMGAGVFLAGLLLNWVLMDALNALRTALGVAALCSLAAFVVWWHDERRERPWGWFLAPVFVTLAVAAVTRLCDVADFMSLTTRYPTGLLRASWETPYGRSEVVAEDATAVYVNSTRVATERPNPEDEESVLAALLAHPAPRRLLILGAFPTPAVQTALTLPWLQVDCAPLDPALADARDYMAPATRRVLTSGRVRIEDEDDASVFLARSPGRYDVIFLNLPLPANALMGRLTTEETLSRAKTALAPGGVLVAAMPVIGVAPDARPMALTAGVARSIAACFATTAMMPASRKVFIFATPDRRAGFPDVYNWPARMKSWNLRPVWLTDANLRMMMTPKRLSDLREGIRAAPPSVSNSPLHPAGHSAAVAAWAAATHVGSMTPLAWVAGLDIWQMGLGILVLGGLCAILLTALVSPLRFGIALAAGILGVSVGTVLAALLMAAQCLNGTLYGQMGLIAGCVLLGAALGGRVTSRREFETDPGATLSVMQVALGVCAAALALILPWMGMGNALIIGVVAQVGIPVLALGVGAIAGTQLPLAAMLCADPPAGTRGGNAALVPVCAVAGGAVGMWAGGSLVLPALGTTPALLGASLLSLISAPLLLLTLRGQGQRPEAPVEPPAPEPTPLPEPPVPPAGAPGVDGGAPEGGPKDGPSTLRSS